VYVPLRCLSKDAACVIPFQETVFDTLGPSPVLRLLLDGNIKWLSQCFTDDAAIPLV